MQNIKNATLTITALSILPSSNRSLRGKLYLTLVHTDELNGMWSAVRPVLQCEWVVEGARSLPGGSQYFLTGNKTQLLVTTTGDLNYIPLQARSLKQNCCVVPQISLVLIITRNSLSITLDDEIKHKARSKSLKLRWKHVKNSPSGKKDNYKRLFWDN